MNKKTGGYSDYLSKGYSDTDKKQRLQSAHTSDADYDDESFQIETPRQKAPTRVEDDLNVINWSTETVVLKGIKLGAKPALSSGKLITVMGLEHGAGTSHIALGLANVVARLYKEEVALICRDRTREIETKADKNVVVLSEMQLEEAIRKYHIKIMDCGIVDEFEEVEDIAKVRAARKVLVCQSDEDYFLNIARFVGANKDNGEYIFLFNNIVKESESYSKKVMAGYTVSFMPSFYPPKPGKEADSKLGEIVYFRE